MSVALRPGRCLDAGRLGAILHHFNRDTPWMPDLHTEAETIAFCGQMIDRGWVTVAACGDHLAGFLARDGEEICALYLHPDLRGRGIGHQLLAQAQRVEQQLRLWAFQANEGALRFYRRAGFVEVARSDGGRNDEGLPDVQMRWQQEEQR